MPDLFSPISLQKLLLYAAECALSWYERGDFNVRTKSDGSPLTQADKDVHRVLMQGLERLYPKIPFFSEEGAIPSFKNRQKLDCFWLCDPIDGTKEFIGQSDEWTINLALIVRGSTGAYLVQAGWVLAPALGLFFQGICRSALHFLGFENFSEAPALRAKIVRDPSSQNMKLRDWNQLQIDSEKRKKMMQRLRLVQYNEFLAPGIGLENNSDAFLQTLKIPVSRNHFQPELKTSLKALAPFETITVGSSLKFCRVAEGWADYYPRTVQLYEWDIAAAHGVLKAAGGNVYSIMLSRGVIRRFDSPEEILYNSPDCRAPMFEAY